MGEARRRKLAGYDPFAAARHRLAGKSGGAVEDFRVPDGCIALTFDIEGVNPSTCLMNPAETPAVLEAMDGLMRERSYPSMVQGVAAEFRKARRTGQDKSGSSLGLMGLWLAFNHPDAGEAMRERVSDALRRDGKVHITLRIGASGLVLALAPQFVDGELIARAAPADTGVLYVGECGPPVPMQ